MFKDDRPARKWWGWKFFLRWLCTACECQPGARCSKYLFQKKKIWGGTNLLSTYSIKAQISTGSVQIGIIIKVTTYFAEPDVLNGEGCLAIQRRSKCGELYRQRGQSAEWEYSQIKCEQFWISVVVLYDQCLGRWMKNIVIMWHVTSQGFIWALWTYAWVVAQRMAPKWFVRRNPPPLWFHCSPLAIIIAVSIFTFDIYFLMFFNLRKDL